MAHTLQTFTFEGTQPVRVHMDEYGTPWWIAADLCAVLDIQNPRDAIARMDEDERGVVSTDTLGGHQDMNTVNEAGLYTLILGSRKPEAKTFKRWITHEVLPSIRQHGNYGIQRQTDSDRFLAGTYRNTKELLTQIKTLTSILAPQTPAKQNCIQPELMPAEAPKTGYFTPKDWFRLIHIYLDEYAMGRQAFTVNAKEVWGLAEGEPERRRFLRYRAHLIAATRGGNLRIGEYIVRPHNRNNRTPNMGLDFMLAL